MRLRWVWVACLLSLVTIIPARSQSGLKAIKVRMINSYGQDAGYAIFKTVKKGVKVKLELKNLRFGVHAVHIHQNAVCDRPDFEGAGPHFNPSDKEHGFLNPMGHHNGDFPAGISIGEDHTGEATFVLKEISLDPKSPDSLFLNGGTSIVVHVRQDDQKTDPSGDSGNRIACGVIKL